MGTGRGRRRTGPTASPPLAGALRPASPLPSPGVWGIVPCSFNFSSDSIRLSAVQMTSFPIRFWFSLTQFPFNPVRFRVHFLFCSLRVHGAATVLGSPLEAAGGWEGLALRRTLGGSRDHVTAAQEPRNRPSAMHCAPPAHSASPAHGAPRASACGKPECTGNRCTRRSPLQNLSALCAFGAAQKGLMQRKFLEISTGSSAPRVPSAPVAPQDDALSSQTGFLGPACPTPTSAGPARAQTRIRTDPRGGQDRPSVRAQRPCAPGSCPVPGRSRPPVPPGGGGGRQGRNRFAAFPR